MNLLYDFSNSKLFLYDDLLLGINNFHNNDTIVSFDGDIYNYLVNLFYNISNNIDCEIRFNDDYINTNVNNSITDCNTVVDSVYDLKENIKKSKSKISIFTSGTTGEPKKIIHTVSSFINMVRENDSSINNVWAFLYDPTHMAGLQVIFQAVVNGNFIVNMFGIGRDEFIHLSNKYKVTNISATPTFYRLMSPYSFTINSIKKVTLGGEKSDNRLMSNLKQVFPNSSILNIYASTEAGTLFISRGDTFSILKEIKGKVKFVDNEIVIHNSLLGEFSKDEWFFTGDIVEFIDDNNTEFIIKSRKTDTVNIGGNRINLLEVEGAILSINEISNTKVYAIDNSILGKVIACDLVVTSEISKKEFKNKLNTILPSFMVPMKIKYVEKLELTRTGKLKRK